MNKRGFGMERHLFLFGSGPPFTKKLAARYASLAGGKSATVALLYEENGNIERDQSLYTEDLKKQGVDNFLFLPLKEDPDQKMIEELKTCTAIIVGGGNTEKYQQTIVDTAWGEVIQSHYQAGRPVAGFSAGALISPKHCVISPKDNPTGSQLYKKGLGLLSEQVISVHFDTWEEEFSLKIAMKKTNTNYGYGIDEGTGIYFINEKVEETDGRGKIHFYKQKDAN